LPHKADFVPAALSAYSVHLRFLILPPLAAATRIAANVLGPINGFTLDRSRVAS